MPVGLAWAIGSGTGKVRGAGWRVFGEARKFVRKLYFKSEKEWREYSKSGKKPADIPATPQRTYADAGWVGMGDWLGTGTVAPRLRQYRSFKKARAFVRKLNLNSNNEWRDYCKSAKRPIDIPGAPERTYAGAGWAGFGDWLGTGKVRGAGWRVFGEARKFVRRLGLKSQTEWHDYCQSGKKPIDIPSHPNQPYAKTGWAGMGDWLGTGTVATRLRQYRSFKKARAFARRLGLKSGDKWFDYCRSGKKPTDIPTDPGQTYAEAGWAGMSDWLGTGGSANQLRQHNLPTKPSHLHTVSV